MNLRGAHWSQVGPSNRIKVVGVEKLGTFKHHLGIEVENFEEENDVGLQEIASTLINNEFFFPLGKVHSFDSQVKHLSAERHKKVRSSLSMIITRVHETS